MSDLGNKEIMARNIKRYMAINNVDRNQMCQDLKIKYTTLCDWLNGNTYPRIDKIELMANYFHINKADLVEGSVDKPEFPPEIRAAARGMMNLSEEDRKTAIEMINFLSKKGREAKDN